MYLIPGHSLNERAPTTEKQSTVDQPVPLDVTMNEPVPTQADPDLYRHSWKFVWAAFAVPIAFLLLDVYHGRVDWFPRSGALALFLAAFAQFKQLSCLQEKHIQNAQRAQKGEPIRRISPQYGALERWVFFAGLYGTAVWAYGDFPELLLMR